MCRDISSKADKLVSVNVMLGVCHYLIKRCSKLQNIVDGMATCYGLDYPGFKLHWGARFSRPILIVTTHVQWTLDLLPRGKVAGA